MSSLSLSVDCLPPSSRSPSPSFTTSPPPLSEWGITYFPPGQPPNTEEWKWFWDRYFDRNRSISHSPFITPPSRISVTPPPQNGGRALTGRARLISSME